MVITASDLRSYQTCRRRFLLEREWRVLRWRSASLFRSCLREGVFRLSNGSDASTTVVDMRTRFLSLAANPGLDIVSGDPWTVAQDWAGMLSTVLTAISRLVLLTLSRPTPTGITGCESSWQPLAFADDTGTLHRWITCDAFDEEVLAREAHSWHVIGDMVMCDAPMMLHAIEIGQQRSGRRHSPWARCYKHPIIAGQCRFQRPDGKGGWRKLSGDKWTPLWYADQSKPDPETWVRLMDADHVTQSLLHHVSIAQPSARAAIRTKAEISQVAAEIGRSLPHEPMSEPMSRTACDPIGGPCPWQHACFRDTPAEGIADLGLYQIRSPRAA